MTPEPLNLESDNVVVCTNLEDGHTVGPVGTDKTQIYSQNSKLYAQKQGEDAVEVADLTGEAAASVITGTIITYPSATIPDDWLECNGQEVGESHTALDTLLNDVYGTGGNGRSLVPDLRGRAVIGTGTGTSLTARALSATGGKEGVTLEIADIPSHRHQYGSHSYDASSGVYGASTYLGDHPTAPLNSSFTGGSGEHENMPPFLALTCLIKT